MLTIETEYDNESCVWVAEVMQLPGAIVSAASREEAIKQAKTLAFRVIADCIEQGEPVPDGVLNMFVAA